MARKKRKYLSPKHYALKREGPGVLSASAYGHPHSGGRVPGFNRGARKAQMRKSKGVTRLRLRVI